MHWLSGNADLLNTLADRLLELGDMSGPELQEYAHAAQAVVNLPKVPDLPLEHTPGSVIRHPSQPSQEVLSHSRTLHKGE